MGAESGSKNLAKVKDEVKLKAEKVKAEQKVEAVKTEAAEVQVAKEKATREGPEKSRAEKVQKLEDSVRKSQQSEHIAKARVQEMLKKTEHKADQLRTKTRQSASTESDKKK